MGVFSRPDSPYWWLYLETSKRRERTKVVIGNTPAQRRESRRLADEVYFHRMSELARRAHRLPVDLVPITFAAFADWYGTNVAAHHRGADREGAILKVLRAAFGKLALEDVSKRRVEEWRTARRRTVGASTVNRELSFLKTMLKAAVPAHLDASPLDGLSGLHQESRETFVLSREQEAQLLAVITDSDRAIIICALDTLMRLSDVINLRRQQDRGTYIVVEDPKVKPYKVPVSARLRAALDAVPDRGPYYFAHRRHGEIAATRGSNVRQWLERMCAKTSPPIPYGRRRNGLTFHCLRHTGATRLAEAGVSMRTIQEIGGWQSILQLERYAHPSEATKRAAVELIGRDVNGNVVRGSEDDGSPK